MRDTLVVPGDIAHLLLRNFRQGLRLSWVDDDTIQVAAGQCYLNDYHLFQNTAALNVTFASLDAGARTVGVNYYVYATRAGIRLSASAVAPSGYTADSSRLLGYLHNGKDFNGGGADGAIFRFSVCSNDLIIPATPYRAHPDLPAGIPLPGMVKIGSLAIGIYLASREDATTSAAGTSKYPASRYGVVPWASLSGWVAMQVLRNSGLRLPTWEEWLGSVEYEPGSETPACMNGNTAYGSASDDAYLVAPGALTSALAGLGAGNLSAGVYKYKVTLVNATGETNGGTANVGTTVVNPAADGQIALTAIPTGAAGTTARKIYRTVHDGSTYKWLYTIPDNVTTTYTDNIADGSLGATEPGWNTTGAQQGTADPTCAGRTLTGTGPRTSNYAVGTPAGRSWYSPGGLADPVGNIYEWVATFFGGLKTASPGTGVAWGYSGDYAYNFLGQAYNPDTGGYTEGLPALLNVGGSWSLGSNAGVRMAYAGNSPGNASTFIGFRAAR